MESVSKVKAILKEKSWELAQAQARIEQLEGDREHSDQQFLRLERAKQREASCREECERRLSSLQADSHRQLSSAKDALQHAKDILRDARDGMHRSTDLEAACKNCHEQLQKLEQEQQSRKGTGSSKVWSVRTTLEGRPCGLRTCPRLHSEAACTSLGATPPIGLSSSGTSLPVVQRGVSKPLCNRGFPGSECTLSGVPSTRVPVKTTALLPPHCSSTFPVANRHSHACENRPVDCKYAQDCQRQQWEVLSAATLRCPRRWPPA